MQKSCLLDKNIIYLNRKRNGSYVVIMPIGALLSVKVGISSY